MKEIIYSAAGAWVWIYVLGFLRFRYKPINCEKCMSGWFCLGLCIMKNYNWIDIPFHVSFAIVFSVLLTKFINKP